MLKKLFIIILICVCFKSNAQLSGGSYTIGSGGNYSSFSAAITAMSSGISGPVIFNIKDGTYTENLTIAPIIGASSTNTITFQSQNNDSTKVTLTSSGSATVKINGASYITFRKLTVKTTNNRVFDIYGGASNNKILNCQLIGYVVNSQAWTYSIIYSKPEQAYANNYNEYSNNLIKYGSRGIHLESYTNGPMATGTKIYKNRFIDQATYAIYLSYNDAPEIIENNITSSVDAVHYSVYLNYCPNKTKFNYNKIFFTIGYGWGLYMNQCHATNAAPNEVFNNFIFAFNTSTSGGNTVGFELNFNQYTRVYHNNFLTLNSQPATNIKGCMYVNGADNSSPSTQGHYDIRNNNFINKAEGYTISINNLGSIDVIDNNNYFSNTTTGKFGRIVSTEYATYATFINALGDSHSTNIDPLYISNSDLHIQNNDLVGKGTNLLSYVSDDIDHQVRPNPPTIGADEPSAKPDANPDAPANITAKIGNPANGLQHHLQVSWSPVSGVDGYNLEYSNNGSSWSPVTTLLRDTSKTYNYNTADNPDFPYYFRIQSYKNILVSSYTAMTTPVYTACDYPLLSALPASTTITLTLQQETPVSNPDYSTFSIYCTTTSKFVQANGSLGVTEIFQTKAQWGINGSIIVTGLTSQTQYCFYAKAKNQDGDIRFLLGSGTTIMTVQPFNSDILCHNSSGCPSNTWYAPNYNTPIDWTNSKGNPAGCVGFSGAWNNYWGNFLRLSQQNCSGLSQVVISFDMLSSYYANHPKDWIRFYLWDQGSSSYKNPVTSVKINGVESIISFGVNGFGFYFTQALNWARVEVTFDLSTVINKTNILFYLDANCYYNDSQNFFVYFDNISLITSPKPSTTCVNTTIQCTSPTASIKEGNRNICENTDISFSLNKSGDAPFSYKWAKNGTNIADATNSIYVITKAVSSNSGAYTCIVSNSCGSVTSNPATLTVISPPASNTKFIKQIKYPGDNTSFSLTPGGTSPFDFQWIKNGNNIVGETNSIFSINSVACGDSGIYTCKISNSCNSISPKIVKLYVICSSRFKFTISGNVKYDNKDSSAMSSFTNNTITNVSLLKNGDSLVEKTETDDDGFFVFTDIVNGNYKLVGSTNKNWSGSNPVDALLVNRNYIGRYPITDPLKKLAADVNNDGKISPTDALNINRRYIGVVTNFVDKNKVTLPDWLFSNPFLNIETDNITKNILAICTGDVNASYSPIPRKNMNTPISTAGFLNIEKEGEFELPVYLNDFAELGALGLKFSVLNSHFSVLGIKSNLKDLIYNITQSDESYESVINIAWSANDEGYQITPDKPLFFIKAIYNDNSISPNSQLPTPSYTLSSESIISDIDANYISTNKLVVPKLKFSILNSQFSIQIYPNPFNAITNINYTIPEDENVNINIYNILGEKVAALVTNELRQAGNHSLQFNAASLREGVYYCVLQIISKDLRLSKTNILIVL